MASFEPNTARTTNTTVSRSKGLASLSANPKDIANPTDSSAAEKSHTICLKKPCNQSSFGISSCEATRLECEGPNYKLDLFILDDDDLRSVPKMDPTVDCNQNAEDINNCCCIDKPKHKTLKEYPLCESTLLEMSIPQVLTTAAFEYVNSVVLDGNSVAASVAADGNSVALDGNSVAADDHRMTLVDNSGALDDNSVAIDDNNMAVDYQNLAADGKSMAADGNNEALDDDSVALDVDADENLNRNCEIEYNEYNKYNFRTDIAMKGVLFGAMTLILAFCVYKWK